MTELVELPSEVSLQIDLESPLTRSEKLAICLHPWSWLGGQKDDPVLLSIVDSLLEEGHHILRFNSRGVGQSTGWSSFTGLSEGKDLEELVTWALDKLAPIKSLVLIGYSHGSLIASLHPIIPTITTSHILISYPLGPRGWLTLFHTNTYSARLKELVQNPASNVLIVYGDEDEFTSISKYRDWSQRLEEESGGGGHLRVVEVKGASHFWRGLSNVTLREEVQRSLS